MKGSAAVAISLVSYAAAAASPLVWPSRWDEVEDYMNMLSGYGKVGFSDAIITCGFGNNQQGRQNSAEWIRTAFHDAVTHDAKAGTGGVDASIFWETKRPENPGKAFENTFSFFSGFHTPKTSASDLVALGTVVATGLCRGPQVPFRAGRVDAYKAGPSGVPEPSTNMKDTFAAFTKAGFTKEDMTAMVACGHAIGGVHSEDFPDVTGIKADPNNDTSVPFQKDVSRFHNGIVTEFLAGTSKNPLVVAKNNTLNSDKRIFNNDRATMKKLSTKAGFNSMCASVFARMIDTVPKSVTLSDVITYYDVKPYITNLYLNSKGKIHFTGSVRFALTNGRKAEDISVKLVYADRSGKVKTTVPMTRGNWLDGLTTGLTTNFVNFEFDTTIDATKGISKFWIQETTPSTKATKTHDNQKTGGYKVDDTVLYQQPDSFFDSAKLANGPAPVTVSAMVRDSRAKETLNLKFTRRVAIKGVDVPKFQTEVLQFKPTGKKSNGFTAYQVKTTTTDQSSSFDIVLSGKPSAGVEYKNTNAMPRS
ncbi:heme peroxidase [Fusarium tricinctum]|uniref:Peroxidase n=2 Tax=Fusarium tricinctum species complex TaxID=679429 RepID=A0A8K0WBA9_9HYPO|nr:heme peroxidase [Fusarium tricinctum]